MQQEKEYNKGGLYMFLFAMVFVLVFFIYVSFIHEHTGPDYKKPAPAAGTTSAVSPEASAPAAPPGGDPWSGTPEVVAKGEALFQINCSVCHGPKGTGDGPGGKALQPPPRNMVEGKWKLGGSPFQLFNTITNGSPGTSMASFAHLAEADRWALVHFVRSLTKNVVEPTDAEIKAFKEQKK